MAVRICDEESDNARTGTSVYERYRDAVAERNAVSGPYDAVAVLAGEPKADQENIQTAVAGRRGDGIGEFGPACGGWDEDFFTSIGTGRAASGSAGEEANAAG